MKHLLLFCLVAASAALGSCSRHEPFRIVLLPDTQDYASGFPHIFEAQTEWIAANADSIAFVLHQGDVTNGNTEREWQAAARAMGKLDGAVPYCIAYGNHDYPFAGPVRDTRLFNEYFPYGKYSASEHFGGAFEEGSMDNTWFTFDAGGYEWLVLNLEFGPRNKVLDWAANVVERHPKHKVIINTHAYMYSDDTRMGEGDDWLPQSYRIGENTGADAVNDGEQMWSKLVSKYPNIMFVFSGHVLHSGVGTLASEGEHGNTVYQMLANYQAAVDGSVNGGNGFLRILNIDPGKGTVSVRTYSPYTEEFKTEPSQQFVLHNVRF